MLRLHITGIVHPERASVYYKPPSFELRGSINGQVSVSIIASQLIAIFNIEQTDLPEPEIYYHIKDFLSDVVNLYGFTVGHAYDFELVNSINESIGQHLVFGVDFIDRNKNPKRETSHESADIILLKFNKLIKAVQHERSFYLFSALDDVKRAALSFKDTGFYCYRAIESVMQFFKEDEINNNKKNSDNESWKTMRNNLDVSRDEIDIVKNKSDSRRHGKSITMTKEEQNQIIEITVEIINKFSEFLVNDISTTDSDTIRVIS